MANERVRGMNAGRPPRRGASPLLYLLGATCLGAIVTAVLVVGPATSSAGAQSRLVSVQAGVVQSTVSGSGNIEPADQLDLGFKTSGVVQRIFVTQGQHVVTGELLAELDPQSGEVALDQARASLQSARASLSQLEEGEGETSGATGAGTSTATAKAASADAAETAKPSRPAKTVTTGATTGGGSSKGVESTTKKSSATTAKESSAPVAKAKQSAATREANLASARATVRSDELAERAAEQTMSDTKLFAPSSGTIVTLAGEVGESVSGVGTSKASSAASGSSAAGTAASTGGSSSARSAGSGTATTSSSSSSSSSAGSFAVLSDLESMQLVVPLSESEIVHVHAGQPATVTVEALESAKLAAHVVAVATLATSNSGVVSYDVTFQLDQLDPRLKPGMSASAEVVVKQEEGLSVPTSAIAGRAVTVVRNGKQVRQVVVTGLAGNSATIVRSGLKAGERVVLRIATTSGATSITSRLAGRGGLGGGLAGGGAAGGFAGGGGPPGG